jgi:tRNA-Thr(GGU) m(6)t(6)A37 methyltransferase TsaA
MILKEIGVIHSCFKQKFGTPRQSGLSKNSYGNIEIFKEFSQIEIIRGLESFSHIWVLFYFHEVKGWHPTIRPPRLGGKERIGVFASRSPHRPNPIGLSVLEITEIKKKNGKIFIDVRGLDILDKTPLFDIKPYIPSVDSVARAKSGWTNEKFPKIENIKFSIDFPENESNFIKEIISLDPRPAHQREKNKDYKFKLGTKDIHFRVKNNKAEVFKVID